MRYLLTLVIGGLLLFAGCSPSITSGDVCDKVCIPAHGVGSFYYIGDTMVWITDHIPDCYFLTIRRMRESDNTWVERKIKVDRDTFDKTQIGDLYDIK